MVVRGWGLSLHSQPCSINPGKLVEDLTMEPLFLPQLTRSPQQTEVIPVNTTLPDLETLTPIQGEIRVVHGGNYLRVESEVATIITLTCDRCLQQYNHRLTTQTSELIWLEDGDSEADLPEDFSVEQSEDATLDETLPANGYFYPEDWLYQQLCLNLPQRNLCRTDCPGVDLPRTGSAERAPVDHRWAALESLKQEFP
jgi:uncharacterized protein